MSKTKKRSENKFNFFVKADIKKAKDEKGNDLIIIDGIASTSSTDDSDGETLYPSGFNLIPFLETGLVNFNHQGSKDANAIIGVPLEAKIINGGKDLYVKCALWPCPQTDGIVRAYENFKKYKIDRKVGFSIEGNSTQRGSAFKENPLYKKVLKADVTGIAITMSPKNQNTLMNIVKGNYREAYIELDNEENDFIGTFGDSQIRTLKDVPSLIKSEVSKSLNPVKDNLSKTNKVIQNGFNTITTLIKSVQQQNAELGKKNETLNDRLDILEKVPNARKSFNGNTTGNRFIESKGEEDITKKDIYIVTNQSDLNRLSDRLVNEYKSAIEKGRKEDALLFEKTINSIEISKKVPEFAYRKLATMDILLKASCKN